MPAELAEQGQALGYTALAITDHDSLSGAMEFAQACAAVGVQPITGVELSIAGPRPETAPRHLTLLAEDELGYASLCRLITLAHRRTRAWVPGMTHRPSEDPRPPLLDFAALDGHTTGTHRAQRLSLERARPPARAR